LFAGWDMAASQLLAVPLLSLKVSLLWQPLLPLAVEYVPRSPQRPARQLVVAAAGVACQLHLHVSRPIAMQGHNQNSSCVWVLFGVVRQHLIVVLDDKSI
jgi:hypothetical protein